MFLSQSTGYEVDVIGNLVPGDLTAYVLDDLVRRRRGPGPSTTKALGRSPIFRYLKIPQVAVALDLNRRLWSFTALNSVLTQLWCNIMAH